MNLGIIGLIVASLAIGILSVCIYQLVDQHELENSEIFFVIAYILIITHYLIYIKSLSKIK